MEEMFLTPMEILEKYPDLRLKFNFTTSDLGVILKCKVVDGYYDRTKRNSMIKESSVMRLIDFLNSSLDSQKIKTN
jgi:hypothetical protein